MKERMRQCLLFELDGQSFGIRAESVCEMVLLDSVHSIPMAPHYVRGVMMLRGHTVSVVDLRLLLGMRSNPDVHRALVEEFKKRKQDHINWIAELESSVRENRTFGLTLDPHQCAFGRWYDGFHSEDPILSHKLLTFDSPHKRIHALGTRIQTLLENGQHEEALCVIDSAREGDMSELLRLFDETIPLMAMVEREIVIVVSNGAHTIGLIVDVASEMRQFDADQIDELPADSPLRVASDLITGIGLQGERVTVLLDCDRILDRLAS